MLEFFSVILKAIIVLCSAVTSTIYEFFSNLIYSVKLLVSTMSSFTSYFTWLPDSCLLIIGLGVVVVVLYKILGREG